VRAMDQEHNIAPALAACTEEERHEAMGRFAVLRPHLHDGVPLPEAARDAGVPLRSVPRWLARYRATGVASASSRLRIGVGDFGNCWDTSKHKEVSHEQEVCSPAVG
jgi:hypothetical protein